MDLGDASVITALCLVGTVFLVFTIKDRSSAVALSDAADEIVDSYPEPKDEDC